MAKVKIISNPYLREISFQRWEESNDQWAVIDMSTDPDGKLQKDSIRTGFFPFIVKDILDILIDEYGDAEGSIEIVFEGTADEYKELEYVCNEDEYKNTVQISRSPYYLENARDILPEIREIYKKIDPLIKQSVVNEQEKIEREIVKFVDASGDLIPICIMGNYSTGKSTFINALIGFEMLPSGDEPITGKIYKILNSKQADRALLKFSEADDHIEIRMEADDFKFLKGQMGSELNTEIYEMLLENKEKPIPVRMRRALEIIEKHVKNSEIDKVGDLIEISVPFNQGLWNQSANNFVIFDTPGSNSASNADHVRVLKKAMEDMSNGMPIFVSEFNSLDSTDNEKLYKAIKAMKELDSRFTMIIVNKADTANLEEEEGRIGLSPTREKRILNLAVPRSIFGEGIFFISSIMGLGAKNDAKFTDKHYMRVFAQNRDMFSDPESILYQRLYRFNIMPEQLKRKSIASAEKQENRIYATSGLYSVEEEIQLFGDRYSAYNKCHQSELFLRKLIDITFNEIETTKQNREQVKASRIVMLEKDKKALVERIEEETTNNKAGAVYDYPGVMVELVSKMIEESREDDLSALKEEYVNLQTESLSMADFEDVSRASQDAVGKNFVEGWKKVWEEKDVRGVKGIFETLAKDYMKMQEDSETVDTVYHQARENADEMILAKKEDDYAENTQKAFELFESESRQFWNSRCEAIKDKLSQIVLGSSALTNERRNELSRIIITYQNIGFSRTDELKLEKKEFERGLFIGKLAVFTFGEINLNKVKDYYNDIMADNIRRIDREIEASHVQSFENWIENLESVIVENIIDYNPELHAQNELIKEETAKILELEKRQKELADYRDEISNKMVWKP